jgi:hypothetical protein
MLNSPVPPNASAGSDSSPIAFPSSVSQQASKLRQLLFTKDTATTFAQSLRLLGRVITELAVLAWLTLCWGIVAIAWIGRNAGPWSQSLKSRWSDLQAKSEEPTAGAMASQASKTLLDKSKILWATIVTTAEKQVGSSQDQPPSTQPPST